MFPWSYDAAYLACLISNIMRGKDRKAYKLDDFMPADYEPVDSVAETWENLRNLARSSDGEH